MLAMPRQPRSNHLATESSDGDSPTAPKRAARNLNKGAAHDLPKESKRERTKDGCLTCRMRRKKCETDLAANGACTTCFRLRIKCYGFGAKRPDWMKDKSEVERKLQEIKDHLVAEGLVRGVAKDKSARKPKAVPSNSPPPLPTDSLTSYLPRPVSPVLVPSRLSPSSSRKQPTTPPRPEVSSVCSSSIVPPIAPLSHPAPGRENPQYLPSRAASRSPVLIAAIPRSPIIPPPLQTTHPHTRDDSDTSDETSPQTPPEGFTLLQPIARSSRTNGNITDWSGMISGEPHGGADTDSLDSTMGVPYAGSSGMDSSATMISDVLPMIPFGPYPPSSLTGSFGPYGQTDPDQDNGYYQDMENNLGLMMGRGFAPTIAGQILSQPWQPLYEAPWPSYILSPTLRSFTPLPTFMRPQEDGFMYYFDHVATMQYIFDASSTDTMHTHIRTNPTGVVATAIKMIAAVHDSQNRKANGLDAGGALRTSGTPEHLYRETYGQIMATLKRNNGVLTEAEATAALHMISYWLFQGGDGQWAEALKIAVHWFQNVQDLYTKKGPQVIRSMSAEQRFAAKTTMWMDIFSSITQLRAPYLNGLYKHLLESVPGTYDFFGTTNGCCDSVMCSLAAIVTLETDMAKSSAMLSLLDEPSRQVEISLYINRANVIREQLMSIDCSPPRFSEVAASYLVDVNATPMNGSTSPTTSESSFETSEIFRQAAFVYLSTVVNGPDPTVQETFDAVLSTHNALLSVPSATVDRSLVFPLCIAGCMTDDLQLREFFADRLQAMDGPVGNSGKTLQLMRTVWSRRDQNHPVTAWRDVMRDSKLELLLV